MRTRITLALQALAIVLAVGLLSGCAPARAPTSFAAGCERYHAIFASELATHERLAQVVDIQLLYALAYQESGCQTRDEFHADLLGQGMDDPTWQGGIMQVDRCWRGDALYNCTTVADEIKYGVATLADSYDHVADRITAQRISLTSEQRRDLLLFGYNRGGYTAQDAIDIYANIQNNQTVPWLNVTENSTTVLVSCVEDDVCRGNGQYIDITPDLALFNSSLDRAMLIACKRRFGIMRGPQGDYCTGVGYGVRYPQAVTVIADKLRK